MVRIGHRFTYHRAKTCDDSTLLGRAVRYSGGGVVLGAIIITVELSWTDRAQPRGRGHLRALRRKLAGSGLVARVRGEQRIVGAGRHNEPTRKVSVPLRGTCAET